MNLYVMTEDQVRDKAKTILKFDTEEKEIIQGVGQLTTFNQLGFKGINDKPDGWYLPKNKNEVAIILETKNSNEDITKTKIINELLKNIKIANTFYNKVIGILYNGINTLCFKNENQIKVVNELQNKEYYLSLFKENKIDKQKIYNLTKQINDNLHINFGIKNLYDRMVFTACALVAERFSGKLTTSKNMGFDTFSVFVTKILTNELDKYIQRNKKLNILINSYIKIEMNFKDNQEAINNFIDNVVEISKSINSDFWNGEDVMAIFFNEFNRYKGKSENGQVFTPEHIASLMYRLIEINKDSIVLDACCGSGTFLTISMCNMIKEAGGVNTKKAKEIKENQLYGIEFDKEIFSLACANMLIHKDGKTNIEHLDTREKEAQEWIKSKSITKVLMNPPYENKYGCIDIVKNVLDSVNKNILCAFILPDKKLEKVGSKKVKDILNKHKLKKIIKLPEKTFFEGVTTSIFIFESGIPQNNEEIFTCYIKEDGLETVKNQGRQDIKNKWQEIEDYWVDIIKKQSGDNSIKWIKPNEFLSYQEDKKEFEITEEDFSKTMLDYLCYENEIDVKEFNEKLLKKILYSSEVEENDNEIILKIKKNKNENE